MSAKSGYQRRKRHGADVVAGTIEQEYVEQGTSTPSTDDDDAAAAAGALAYASLDLAPRGELPLYGSQRFFEDCIEQTLVSTKHGLELAGAVYTKKVGNRLLLVGLCRKMSGEPGRVAIDPRWGEILWHTHPGMRGSLAAFSDPDLEAAKLAKRPLLVIGFGGLSPDVVTTLGLPFGLKFGWQGLLFTSGLKGLVALERYGRLKERLLRMGVAARVCYPSGHIEPVLRQKPTPLQAALDDVGYTIDQSIGAIERVGQRAIRTLVKKAVDKVR